MHISKRLIDTDPADKTVAAKWIAAYLEKACGLDIETVRTMLEDIRECPRDITSRSASELKPLWDQLLYGGE